MNGQVVIVKIYCGQWLSFWIAVVANIFEFS